MISKADKTTIVNYFKSTDTLRKKLIKECTANFSFPNWQLNS